MAVEAVAVLRVGTVQMVIMVIRGVVDQMGIPPIQVGEFMTISW